MGATAMSRWLQIAEQADERISLADKRDNRDDSPGLVPIVPFVSSVHSKEPTRNDPERAAIMEFDGDLSREEAERLAALSDVPDEWIAGVDQLQFMPAPVDWTGNEWCQLQDDATAFLVTRGAQAHGLGWTAHDIFGCHTLAPRVRYDFMGLVLLLHGHRVVDMDERTARIGIRQGITQSFSRRQNNEAVLIWDLAESVTSDPFDDFPY
jgi:hypothetical protein